MNSALTRNADGDDNDTTSCPPAGSWRCSYSRSSRVIIEISVI